MTIKKIVVLNLLFLLSAQAPAKDNTHQGHKHKAGEDCELSGNPSEAATKLGAQVEAVVKKIEYTPEFCAALKECADYNYNNYCNPSKDSYYSTLDTKCGLPKQEMTALNFYMGSGYSCINPALYGKSQKKVGPLVDSINSGLKKFPPYEGFVARGATLPQEILDQHKEGAVVNYKAFTSSSTAASTAQGFVGDSKGAVIFLIYSKTGRPIMGISDGENEVLFGSNTNFKVLKRREGKSVYDTTAQYILMREVSKGETAAKAKQLDKFVLSAAKALPEKSKKLNYDEDSYSEGAIKADTWACPNEGSIPSAPIKQKLIPDFGKAAEYFKY